MGGSQRDHTSCVGVRDNIIRSTKCNNGVCFVVEWEVSAVTNRHHNNKLLVVYSVVTHNWLMNVVVSFC